MSSRDGWSGLFATAFEQSQNAMILADSQRVIVDVNPALLALLGRKKDAVTGRPVASLVAGGPLLSEEEWAALKVVFFNGGDQGITVELCHQIVNLLSGKRRKSPALQTH